MASLNTGTVEAKQETVDEYELLKNILQKGFLGVYSNKTATAKQLSRVFPELKETPEALNALSEGLCEKYNRVVEEEFETLLRNTNMQEKMVELFKNRDANTSSWRPSGSPEKDLQAHLAFTKYQQVQRLRHEVETKKLEVKQLRNEVHRKDVKLQLDYSKLVAKSDKWIHAGKVAQANQENLLQMLELARK